MDFPLMDIYNLPKKFDEVLQRWKTNSRRDLFEAVVQKEKDLESWKNTTERTFPKEWKEPPFLIPHDEKNAEVINDILKKSWEIQTGKYPNLPFTGTLISQFCFIIHGFLKYYIDCLGLNFLLVG